jgi:hypothetical protein
MTLTMLDADSCNGGGNPTWPNLPVGLTFERNIVYLDNITVVAEDSDYRWDTVLLYILSALIDWLVRSNSTFANNVYFSTASNDLTFPNKTDWATWQQRDPGSCVCDPKLADVGAGNWTLLADSPAWARGFEPINLSFVTGPQ